MITFTTFQTLALSFPEAIAQAHFEKISYRVAKKIFATYDEKTNRACIKLNKIDQQVFCMIDVEMISPVPNKWGKQGWTFIALQKITKALCKDALTKSYQQVAPKRLLK